MFIDSHAHLDMEQFDPDRDEVIQRALSSDVGQVVTVGIDVNSSVEDYPGKKNILKVESLYRKLRQLNGEKP